MARRFEVFCLVCNRPIASAQRGFVFRVGAAEIAEYSRDGAVIRCVCGEIRFWTHTQPDPAPDPPTQDG